MKNCLIFLFSTLGLISQNLSAQSQVKIIHDASVTHEDIYLNDKTSHVWLVVTDTAKSYPKVLAKMIECSKHSGLEIDSMGRTYAPINDSLIIPLSDSLDLYAGQYFPRRFPSQTLSIEYLDYYWRAAPPRMLGIVAGIYESQSEAMQCLEKLQSSKSHGFLISSRLYMGCMH